MCAGVDLESSATEGRWRAWRWGTGKLIQEKWVYVGARLGGFGKTKKWREGGGGVHGHIYVAYLGAVGDGRIENLPYFLITFYMVRG